MSHKDGKKKKIKGDANNWRKQPDKDAGPTLFNDDGVNAHPDEEEVQYMLVPGVADDDKKGNSWKNRNGSSEIHSRVHESAYSSFRRF